MDIKELVNILSNNLPANYEGVSFYDFAKNKLEEYVTLLSATDKNEFDNLLEATGDLGLNKNKTQRRFVNLIKVINQTCLKILQLAYKGDMYNAISTLSKLMTVSKATKGYLADRYLSYLKFAADDGRIYYRFLKLNSNIEPKNCNHLPYNLRRHASPNRFNQIGFPCLYVASSLDIAEKESNCKVFSKKGIRNSQSNMQTFSISPQDRTKILSLQIRRDGTCVKKYFSLLAQSYT